MTGATAVDETDFLILREIFHGGAESFRSDRIPVERIAKVIGAHRNTVSARIRRLTEARVLLPASLEVEPAAFGLVASLAFLEVSRERRSEALRDAVFALPGVQLLFSYVEGWGFIVYAESESALMEKLVHIREITGAREARLDTLSTRDYPPMEPLCLTPLDTRLILALLADSRASFNEVSKNLDVNAITAKRRFARLAREGVVYVYPSGNAHLAGMVMGFVVVDVPEDRETPRVSAEIARLMPNHWFRNTAVRGRVFMILYARSIEALESQAALARRVPGVGGVELRILTAITMNPRHRAWLARAIETRAGARPPTDRPLGN